MQNAINSYPQLLQFYKEKLDNGCYLEIFNASKAFAESLTIPLLRRWGSDLEIKSVKELNKQQLIIAILQINFIEDPEGDPEGFAFF